MSLDPAASVHEGLTHLAQRLDPIIQQKLDAWLGGIQWTDILTVLDEKKGQPRAYPYFSHDLHPQLRLLTERLGDWGYPFDDEQRTVSTLGNELRIVRNHMAHMREFTIGDAYRANDFCVRLLEYFGDETGVAEAKRIRHEALGALAHHEGITQAAAEKSSGIDSVASLAVQPDPPTDVEETFVTPDDDVLTGEPSMIGDRRLQFEPWTVVLVGESDVFNNLRRTREKEQVRGVAAEIASYESPIYIDRLVTLTARSFRVQRVYSKRRDQIRRQIRQTDLLIDTDKFVWSDDMGPQTWTEFRPNDSDADRPFEHISPVEIANAARFIRASQPQLPPDELDAAVLRTFGRHRRTKKIREHLAKAKKVLGR